MSLGYVAPDEEPGFYRTFHYECRLINAVLDAGIWFLSEFVETVADTPTARDFLSALRSVTLDNGHEIVAVPYDVMVFLIVRHRRKDFTKDDLLNMGFNEPLYKALVEID